MMITERHSTVCFSGHRSYNGVADVTLHRILGELYDRGFRTFMSGMAVGFDLAAAEAVLQLRAEHADVQLVAVVPFEGQQSRFSDADRERFGRIVDAANRVEVLSQGYHAGCYAVRNNFLTDHASLLVAWYANRPGGTQYTVRRAQQQGLELINLHPAAPLPDLQLFG